MSQQEQLAGRDNENPDPQEMNRPIPKVVIVLVVLLLGWAIYYIATQAPGLESSSTAPVKEETAAAPPTEGR